MAVPSTAPLLSRLRTLMTKLNIHAYIVPSCDAHQSEYIADCDMRRQFISKFTGSCGTVLVTLEKAALWTDGRYHLQASKELDLENWILMKDGLPDVPTQSEWLKDVLDSGHKVGVDPFLLSHDSWKKLSKDIRSRNISLVPIEENLIDKVWEDTTLQPSSPPRPLRPAKKLMVLPGSINGKSWTLKVSELRKELKKQKTGSFILTALDDIAWLLNLRGSDVDYNPVFFAYCIVTMDNVYLFIDESKLTSEVREAISGDKDFSPVQILPYESIRKFITESLVPQESKQIWISNGSSEAIISCVPKEKRYLQPSPVARQKSIKNPIEIQNMRDCHIRDAAALCEYLCWLEKTIEANPEGHESLWEIEGADQLENFRKQQENFVGLSFPSISASGPNGAVIHYHPSVETRRPIGKNELYLIDSGAQFVDGTTDVTRTVHFGEPTSFERECFTRVLKGHIQLAKAVFPKKAKGYQLDSFARKYLWEQGLDYLHGTGHGVGMYLNVHEGPTSISPSASAAQTDPGLEVGKILSNEPGYYEADMFGIRIESLMVTRAAETPNNFNNLNFLNFETITLVPIQLKMIDLNLLTDDEIAWLNEYHSKCLREVGAYLQKMGKQDVKSWLIKETKPVSRPQHQ